MTDTAVKFTTISGRTLEVASDPGGTAFAIAPVERRGTGNERFRLSPAESERLAIALIQATPVPATGKADADEALVFIESDGAARAVAYGLALIRAAKEAK